jgi:competence protein ComEC
MNIGGVYYGENPGECKAKKTCVESDTETNPKELMELIKSKNIPMTILTVGNNVRIGNLTFDIVAPTTFRTSGSYRENYNSLNMILKFGKNKFYFSGDYVGTSEILSKYDASTLDVDVFKWPHHGQMDISNKFLDVLTPAYIIVPNTSIATQAQNGIKHTKATGYATGSDGYVLVESDGTNYNVTKVSKR